MSGRVEAPGEGGVMGQGKTATFRVAATCALAILLGCGQSGESRIVAGLGKLAERWMPAAQSGREEASDAERLARLVPDDPGERRALVIEGGEFSSLDDGGGGTAAPAIYRYTDENGVVRMVQGLHAVPERYRSSARSLSKSSMPVINRYRTQGDTTRRRTAYQPPASPNRSEVVLYSAEWCGACRKARAFLDREGVRYELRDIDRDPGAKSEVRQILGRVRIPLLDIDGTYVAGFAPAEIRRALREAG